MIEVLVALDVKDEELYTQYRDAIAPLLKEYQGFFPYDVTVQEMLEKDSNNKKINRIFTLRFETEELKEGFFRDERYLKIKCHLYYFNLSPIKLHRT